MRKLIKKILREWDDMDWIRDADINPPYFKNMKEYGLKPNEYNSVLSKTFNQPVSIDDGFQKRVYNKRGFEIYIEDNDGSWEKWEYDANGNEIYGENSYGYWYKKEYDDQGNEIYYENSNGDIRDNRHLNESDELDWIRDTQPISYEDLLGKALHFQPLITNDGSLDRILDFLENLGFKVGNYLRDFDFEEEGMDLEGLYLNPITNKVTWTSDLDYSGEDYEEHISNYADRPVEVLDGWRTLEDYI